MGRLLVGVVGWRWRGRLSRDMHHSCRRDIDSRGRVACRRVEGREALPLSRVGEGILLLHATGRERSSYGWCGSGGCRLQVVVKEEWSKLVEMLIVKQLFVDV